MAADVTSIFRIMEAHREEADGKRRGLLTRDLLGEGAVGSSTELDLDLQVPSGWERRLDLMSGKTYLHRLDSLPPFPDLHDLNLPPPSSLPEDSSLLDLKLAGASISGEYQSVCTLDKVKSALERAHRRPTEEDEEGASDSEAGMMAAACPTCLLYLLISKASPRCPRCDSHVPAPVLPKKPRFDLNAS